MFVERAPRDVGAPRGGLGVRVQGGCSVVSAVKNGWIFFLEKPPFTQIYHRPSKILKTEQIWTCIRGWTQSKILVRRTTFIVEGISRKVLSLVQKENDVCRYKVDGPFRWFAQGPHTRRVCDDRAVADRLCGAHRAHAAAAPTRRSRAHARENTDGNSWQSRPRRACASHEAVLLPRGCRASAARCSARSRRPAAIVSAANVRAFVPGARV